jgi:Ca2+-binding EF-hand superfamily protein
MYQAIWLRPIHLLANILTVLALAGCNRGGPPVTPVTAKATAAIEKPPTPEPAKVEIAPAPQPSEQSASTEAQQDEAAVNTESAVADELSFERLILFLPEAPLLVELRMTIDGQPFRAVREELVDEVLKLADRDSNGRPTWEEIYSDPKQLVAERFGVQKRNITHKEFLKSNDTNQNGEVDREEARRIVARAKSAGEAFSLESSTEYRDSNRRLSIVRTMLDANSDDVLERSELDRAEDRLLARDANDDHIITWDELDDSLAGDEQAMSARQNAYLNQPAALRLGPRAAWDGIVYALAELYLSGGEVPDDAPSLVKSLAARLDADHNGALTFEEVRNLDSVEPQVVLAANFGRSGDLLAGVSVVRLSDDLGPADEVVVHSPRGVLLRLPHTRLQVVLDDRLPPDGQTAAEAQFEMLDKDMNGYLEKAEVTDLAADVAKVFEEADEDADGKLYLTEMTAYRRRQQPQSSAIQAVAADDQDVLFPLLDANHDGRLTTRELHAARESLSVLAADRDGQIALDELPGAVTLWLGRGMPSNMSPRRNVMAAVVPATASGPPWFVAMDANRDQEVSLDEFPGTADKFRSVDLDGDGFLSPSEALTATENNE